MDYWEHLGATDNSVNLKVWRIEVDLLINGLLIVIDISQLLVVSFVEAVDFIFHIFSKSIHLFFDKPFCVKVASSPIFN